jgi:hypothetical protein
MLMRSSGFLKGVVLAADAALPKVKRKILIADAATLAAKEIVLKIPEKITPPCTLDTAHVFAPWLKYRQKEPMEKLSVQVATRVGSLARRCTQVSTKKSIEYVTTFPDLDFAALLGGAQTVVKHFAPEVSNKILTEDWTEFGRALPELVLQYEQNGVPKEGILELLTMEYTRTRLRSVASFGASLKNLFTGGGWYGWLEVHTIPELASVRVDKEDWGESPKGRGVSPGKHHVSAKKERLGGEQDTVVPAAGSRVIDLALA